MLENVIYSLKTSVVLLHLTMADWRWCGIYARLCVVRIVLHVWSNMCGLLFYMCGLTCVVYCLTCVVYCSASSLHQTRCWKMLFTLWRPMLVYDILQWRTQAGAGYMPVYVWSIVSLCTYMCGLLFHCAHTCVVYCSDFSMHQTRCGKMLFTLWRPMLVFDFLQWSICAGADHKFVHVWSIVSLCPWCMVYCFIFSMHQTRCEEMLYTLWSPMLVYDGLQWRTQAGMPVASIS